MRSTTDETLSQAFELIERDELESARAILDPILAREQDNVDAWWLYAHAVTDTAQAHQALDHVMRLDPQYPGASELFSALKARVPAEPASRSTGIKSLSKPTAPSAPESLPGLPGDEELDSFDDWDEMELEPEDIGDAEDADEEAPGRRRRRLFVPLAMLLFVLILLGIVIVINLSGTTRPTVVTAPTTTPTEVIPATAQPTEESVSGTAMTASDFGSIYAALADFNIPDNGVQITDTLLGQSLIVTACTDRGNLAEIMDKIAQENQVFANEIEAVAVQIGECEIPAMQRTIAVKVSDISAYAGGSLSQQEFQKLWQPIG